MQNYFGDPWNAFDFFIVAGSLVDLGMAKINVSMSHLLPYVPGHGWAWLGMAKINVSMTQAFTLGMAKTKSNVCMSQAITLGVAKNSISIHKPS